MLVCKFVSRFYLLLLLFNSILSLFFFPLERTIQFWCVRSQWKSLALWQQNEANSEQYKKRIQTNERTRTAHEYEFGHTHTYTTNDTRRADDALADYESQCNWEQQSERESESGWGHNICSKYRRTVVFYCSSPDIRKQFDCCFQTIINYIEFIIYY